VRIRPNFSYGNGDYGPTQNILVNGTAAGAMFSDEEMFSNEKSDLLDFASAIYPNPNQGEMLNINLTGLTAQFVHVRILNQLGQTVYQNQFGADGSLNTVIVLIKNFLPVCTLLNLFLVMKLCVKLL
jgi:hypothetical protein